MRSVWRWLASVQVLAQSLAGVAGAAAIFGIGMFVGKRTVPPPGPAEAPVRMPSQRPKPAEDTDVGAINPLAED